MNYMQQRTGFIAQTTPKNGLIYISPWMQSTKQKIG